MTVDEWRAAWTAALDRLEEDVTAAESLLAQEHRLRELPVPDPWRPPTGLGPLPLDLRPRADDVLARQLAVARRLAASLTGTARQAAVLDRVESARPAPRPSYLDCAM